MPRGIPWDDLPTLYDKYKPPKGEQQQKYQEDTNEGGFTVTGDGIQEQAPARDYIKDAKSIGLRGAFGMVCGGLTGAIFGTVNALKDTKAMTARNSLVTKKIMQTAGYFGSFFAAYHGLRKAFSLYSGQPKEANIAMATVASVVPLVTLPPLRPMIPYGLMLIVLDIANGWKEGDV